MGEAEGNVGRMRVLVTRDSVGSITDGLCAQLIFGIKSFKIVNLFTKRLAMVLPLAKNCGGVCIFCLSGHGAVEGSKTEKRIDGRL